jgi:cytochrome oxidase Cu insertion factor (SCO1/SenC/PrrC family)
MKRVAITLGLSAALAFTAVQVNAHENEAHSSEDAENNSVPLVEVRAPTAEDERAREYFTDRRVVTQQGDKLRFYSDVLRERVVLITLFYTDCDGMCPLINQTLARVRGILAEDMGKEYWFVSITLDPEIDTVEVLRDYAENFSVGDGWLFLTGDKSDIKEITTRLGQLGDNIETHVPYLMLGNVPDARWLKLRPNSPPEAIAERLRLLAAH